MTNSHAQIFSCDLRFLSELQNHPVSSVCSALHYTASVGCSVQQAGKEDEKEVPDQMLHLY